VILWKSWLLKRVAATSSAPVPAFWAAPSLEAGRDQLAAFDRESALQPLLAAAMAAPAGQTLEAKGHVDSQLTRRLRRRAARRARPIAVRPSAARFDRQHGHRSSGCSERSGASTTR
jgi:hypothetical protein